MDTYLVFDPKHFNNTPVATMSTTSDVDCRPNFHNKSTPFEISNEHSRHRHDEGVTIPFLEVVKDFQSRRTQFGILHFCLVLQVIPIFKVRRVKGVLNRWDTGRFDKLLPQLVKVDDAVTTNTSTTIAKPRMLGHTVFPTGQTSKALGIVFGQQRCNDGARRFR